MADLDGFGYHSQEAKTAADLHAEQAKMARVNLVQRLHEQETAAKHPRKTPPVQPLPVSAPAAVPPPTPPPTIVPPKPVTQPVLDSSMVEPIVPITSPVGKSDESRRRQVVILGAVLVVLLAGGAFAAYAVLHKPAPAPSPPPVQVVHRTPSPTPSRRPTPRLVIPKPPPPKPNATTYTVQQGDSLITIGQQLNKDWHAIAAANGNISDPNLIYPGEVLTIP